MKIYMELSAVAHIRDLSAIAVSGQHCSVRLSFLSAFLFAQAGSAPSTNAMPERCWDSEAGAADFDTLRAVPRYHDTTIPRYHGNHGIAKIDAASNGRGTGNECPL